MRKLFIIPVILVICLLAVACRTVSTADPLASNETRNLFENLRKLDKGTILYGHQDDLAYGIRWANEPFRSDVADVCGKFPAVFGWDLSKLENDSPLNIDSVPFARMKEWMIEAFHRGGVNTVSWHMDNLATGGNAWDVGSCVKSVLPGGTQHEPFKLALKKGADFFLSLRDSNDRLVPVIFRPWHENDGSWFWWGQGNCTSDEYIALWRFTVQYLRDTCGVHNLLYAYSWGDFTDEAGYKTRYPGDEWVDVLGVDIYGSLANEKALQRLRVLVQMAEKYNKLAALTEAGDEGLKTPEWYTGHFLNPITADSLAKGIAYFLVWRNGTEKHFYAPYPGHPSCDDFIRFEKDPATLFLGDCPGLYESK